MKTKNNPWMIATIIFGVMIIGIIAYQVNEKNSEVYNFNDIQLSKKVLDDASKIYGEEPFIICNIKDKICKVINKIGE